MRAVSTTRLSRNAHILGTHDLVGLALLQESVHVDSRAVRKRVAADHGLVGRNRDAEHVGHQAAGAVELARFDAGVHAEVIAARAEGHDDFLERGVAGPLADAVDGAFHLARAVLHAGQRIGHRQAQIVVAVDADGRPADVGHVLADRPDQAPYCSGTV